MIACLLFGFGSDGIFQVENETVGAARETFRKLVFAVGGNEEQRAHEAPLLG